MGSEIDGRTLNETPTWAVAGVCALIVLISILLENGLHALGILLKKKQKAALYEALDKVKGELMVLGFISLLLTFMQNYISKICIPSKVADMMLPCSLNYSKSSHSNDDVNKHGRRLLWNDHRILSSKPSDHKCDEGYESLITSEAAHQLHILIFFLAVFHVLYSALTMMLGKLKIKGWKNWECETLTLNYESTNDPSRLRLTHETSFVKTHTSFWTRIPFFFYVGCFFGQFFKSVTKADYLTLRNGFITVHIGPGGKFNFQKYIKRSLEDDFKVVVGVSPVLWASFVIFLLLNVNGWHTLFWASLLPLIVILAIGTKLQAILTKMAMEITERHAVVQGIPLVQGSDSYFWFSKPRLILHLLHFTLFQNAFQITYFLWIWYEFGKQSCFHDKPLFAIIKIAMGLSAMVLCSYSILPLYALVTQMGSNMKKTIFDEQTSKALKKWHKAVKKKQDESDKSPQTIVGANSKKSTSPLKRHTSGPILHRFMSTGCISSASAYEQLEPIEFEGDQDRPTVDTVIVSIDDNQAQSETTTHPKAKETRVQDNDS
ncbi:hypothetical protein RND81_06G025400 [Saponaria officinalis]|uniref:MLO-like protein n=1 Tax=Saponaria officinalis TaxID=3572 RepID=A0AAW1K5X4_SAPOF